MGTRGDDRGGSDHVRERVPEHLVMDDPVYLVAGGK